MGKLLLFIGAAVILVFIEESGYGEIIVAIIILLMLPIVFYVIWLNTSEKGQAEMKKAREQKEAREAKEKNQEEEERSRRISSETKREVWRRDEGKCVSCGSRTNLEYDHIIPHSQGGSNTVRNIELLCEKCNRSKSAKIM